MALIAEDGSGLPDAESYVSVADATAYCAAMGHSDWIGDVSFEPLNEVALRQATAYIDSRYRFKGERLNADQALEWPRAGESWPQRRIVHACCELAVRALNGPLYQDVQPEGSIKRDTIGPLATEYFDVRNGGQVRYAFIDDMLAPLTISGNGVRVVKLLRA